MSRPPDSDLQAGRRVLFLACLLYLVTRGLVLVTNFDAVAMPIYELQVGNVAKRLGLGLEGVSLAAHFDNSGGGLVVGLLAAPLYALLDDSYLVLKLVPVLLGLGTLLMLWQLLARHFDRRAADLAALLFVFPPPTLFKYSMIAKGNHFENLFFQMAVALCVFRALTSNRRGRWVFASGVAAGVAVFVSLGTVPTLIVLSLLVLAVRSLAGALRDLLVALPGLLVGLSPLLWVELSTGGRATQFVTANLGGRSQGGLLERIGELFGRALPRAGVFDDVGPVPGRVVETVFLAGFVVAFGVLLVRLLSGFVPALRAPPGAQRLQVFKTLPLLAFLPVFALVFASSNLGFDMWKAPVEVGTYRYFVSHFLYATMILSLAATWAWRRGGASRVFGLALGACVLATGLCSLSVIDLSFASPNLGGRYDGHSFGRYAGPILRDALGGAELPATAAEARPVAAALAALPPSLRAQTIFGVGASAGVSSVLEARRLDLELLLAPYESAFHIDLVRGAGSGLRTLRSVHAIDDRQLARLCADVAAGGHPLAPYVAEGLSRPLAFTTSHDVDSHLRRSAGLGNSLPPEWREAGWRGRGMQCGQLLARGIPADVERVQGVLRALPGGARPDFSFGLGWGLLEGDGESLPANWRDGLPQALQLVCLQGYGAALRHRWGKASARRKVASLAASLSEAEGRALERGLRWPDYPRPQGL